MDKSFVSKIYILIQQGNLLESIDLLLNSKNINTYQYNNLLILSNRLHRLISNQTKGLLSNNEVELEEASIIQNLLIITEDIEKSINQKQTPIDLDINKNIKNLLHHGDLEAIVRELNSISSPSSTYRDELLLLQNRLNLLRKREIAGLLSRTEYEVERRKLTMILFDLIDRQNEEVSLFSKANIDQKIYHSDNYVQEAKLIIVGEPGSGKTSLMRKLINENYKVPQPEKKDEESTVGINVSDDWTFPVAKKKNIKFRVNIWDFGGQEIQYMTHQLFLTPESLYILVADDRKQHTNFQYWFEIIHLLGSENEIQSPILVVLNENKHCSISNFDISLYRKKYKETLINLSEVDLSLTDHRFKNLRTSIENMLVELPHLSRKIPVKWLNIRNEITKIREKNNYLNFDAFKRICNKNKIKNNEEILLISRYLHNLGIILHFQDDLHLKNFIVLNVKWALEAVYSILKGKNIKENFGKFTVSDLDVYWKKYSLTEKGNLLNLMMKNKFEICYKTSKADTYIAPQLLQNIRPKYEFANESSMRFRYQYRFMPKGILTRTIVRKHESISNEGRLVWQTGVIIDYQKCQIEIVEEYSKNYIDIKVQGPTNDRRYALRSIRDEIESVHNSWFSSVEFQRQIRCDCELCSKIEEPVFFDYEALFRFWEKDKKTIDCTISVTERSVVKLIEGIFDQSEITRDKKIYSSSENSKIVINNIINDMNNQKQSSSEPWSLYSYLIAIIVVVGILAIVFQVFDIWKCLLLVTSTVLLVLLAGVLQLQNDSRLKEKTFQEIIKLILGKIPGLGVFFKVGKDIK